jgi:hypothetical protein
LSFRDFAGRVAGAREHFMENHDSLFPTKIRKKASGVKIKPCMRAKSADFGIEGKMQARANKTGIWERLTQRHFRSKGKF